MAIKSIIICLLSKLWKGRFFILWDVIFLGGCRGHLKLITLGSERVKSASFQIVAWRPNDGGASARREIELLAQFRTVSTPRWSYNKWQKCLGQSVGFRVGCLTSCSMSREGLRYYAILVLIPALRESYRFRIVPLFTFFWECVLIFFCEYLYLSILLVYWQISTSASTRPPTTALKPASTRRVPMFAPVKTATNSTTTSETATVRLTEPP